MRILKPLPGTLPMPGNPLADAVCLWPMNSLGNKVFDLGGKRNDGILQGDTHFTSDRFGSVLDFDGNGDFVNCGSSNLGMDVTQELSFVVLFRLKPGVANSDIILGKGARYGRPFRLYYTTSSMRFYIRASSVFSLIYGHSPTNYQWQHAAGTCVANGGPIKLYKDGILRASNTSDGGLSFHGTDKYITFGGYWYLSATGFNAPIQIAHVIMWNRALLSSEIALVFRERFCMFPESRVLFAA